MFNKLIRLGRDAELRTTNNGKQVLSFAGAYSVGFGDNKKTQWIDCALWGDRGAKVAQHMVKGAQVVIYADDLELETYPKNDGTQGSKLKCRVVSFDFAGGNTAPASAAPQQQAAQSYQQAPQQQAAPQGQAPAFNEFDDSIPF